MLVSSTVMVLLSCLFEGKAVNALESGLYL